MSDDEFSDFSDDQPTLISIPDVVTKADVETEKETELVMEKVQVVEEEEKVVEKIEPSIEQKLETTPDEIDEKPEVKVPKEEEKILEMALKEEEDDVDIQFPLTWNEYKKIEADVLKFILLFCWVEEKFVVRASLKNIMYDKDFSFKTEEYDIKKYKEKTYEFLPKLCLLYIIFNFLEKCPHDEFFESKSILYVARMYKKSPKELLTFFKDKTDSDVAIERCLGYYSKIYLQSTESREAQDFIELEKNKVKLESLF